MSSLLWEGALVRVAHVALCVPRQTSRQRCPGWSPLPGFFWELRKETFQCRCCRGRVEGEQRRCHYLRLGFSSKDRGYPGETAREGLVSRWVQERGGGPGPIQGCYGGGSSFWSCSDPPKLWVPGAHCPTSPQLLQASASRPAAETVHSITEQGFVVCLPYARHCVGNITMNKTRNPPSEQILVEFTI